MALEIISEPTGAPTGSFTPRADQKKYRSAWGLVSSTNGDGGFTSAHTLQNGITTGDGRRKLPFREFRGEDKQPHEVKFNGKTLREFYCDKADAEAKDLYDGLISNERMAGYLAPSTVTESTTQVGMQKGGDITSVQVPVTHQY